MKLKYLLIFFLLIFVLFNFSIFFLSHLNNDEIIYNGLACKISKFGPLKVFKEAQYNLYNLALFSSFQYLQIAYSKLEVNNLIVDIGYFRGLERNKLSHHPPLLPFTLSCARFFNTILPSGRYIMSTGNAPADTLPYHLETAMVIIFFHIFTLLLLYYISRRYIKDDLKIFPLLLLASSPVWMVSTNKFWAESLLVFLITLSLYYFLQFLEKEDAKSIFWASFFSGLAGLAKMSGLFLPLAFWGFYLLLKLFSKEFFRDFKKIIIAMASSALGLSLSFGWWLLLYTKTYSSPTKHLFVASAKAEQFESIFMKRVHSRPWYFYLLALIAQAPVYLFFYWFLIKAGLKKIKINREKLFLISYIAFCLIILSKRKDRELRYLLIAYPAIAILASIEIQKLYNIITKKILKVIFLLLLVITLCCQWGYGAKIVFERNSIFPTFMDDDSLSDIDNKVSLENIETEDNTKI